MLLATKCCIHIVRSFHAWTCPSERNSCAHSLSPFVFSSCRASLYTKYAFCKTTERSSGWTSDELARTALTTEECHIMLECVTLWLCCYPGYAGLHHQGCFLPLESSCGLNWAKPEHTSSTSQPPQTGFRVQWPERGNRPAAKATSTEALQDCSPYGT